MLTWVFFTGLGLIARFLQGTYGDHSLPFGITFPTMVSVLLDCSF